MAMGIVNVPGGGGSEEKLTNHLADKNNPHGVTAEQIGAAAAHHTHTVGQISGLPTSLPASDVYDWAKQPNKPTYTANEVGAAPSGHTHTAGQISGLPTSLPASDVYPWAKQPNKPAYSASEVGAAGSNHNHDDRYYTEAEVNNLLTSIKTRLTKLEGSVDMAKLVYSVRGNISTGSGRFTKTYNAAFVRVKVSHGGYPTSGSGYLGMAYVDVPKGGDGSLCGVALDMYISYGSNGELSIEGHEHDSSRANYEYVHIEFYNY